MEPTDGISPTTREDDEETILDIKICPTSLAPIYILTYHIRRTNTSWTDIMMLFTM